MKKTHVGLHSEILHHYPSRIQISNVMTLLVNSPCKMFCECVSLLEKNPPFQQVTNLEFEMNTVS
jgi:hypothetical protein